MPSTARYRHPQDLVGDLYAAALEPDRWTAALDGIGDALGGAALVFGYFRFNDLICVATNRLDPGHDALLRAQYARPDTNPLLAAMPSLQVLKPKPRQLIMSDDAYLASGLYNEIFRPQGLIHVATACLAREPDGFMSAGLLRRDNGDFTDEHNRLYTALLPHVRRALELTVRARELAAPREYLEAASAAAGDALLILSADRKVLWANPLGLSLLEVGDGLTTRGGRLSCSQPNVAARLANLIEEAASRRGAQGGSMRIPRPKDLTSWAAVVTPAPSLPQLRLRGAYAALLRLVDLHGHAAVPAQRLVELFALSRAEANLAAELLKGISLEAAAQRRGVTIATIRTQLRSIFSKTDTTRQSELVALLSRVADAAQTTRPRARAVS